MTKSKKIKAKVNEIYMDYASAARKVDANPGAIHALGVAEKARLQRARKSIADVLGALPDEIVFTSGATESNNLAILGMRNGIVSSSVARSLAPLSHSFKKNNSVPHAVTTNIEHASVLETCKHFGKVTFVPVESNGIVDPKKIKKAIRPNTVLVSVMYANNEIGTIQPIREIAKEIRHYNKTHKNKVYFHTDATQAVNYLPIMIPQLGVDMMSFNSAKIYGPKGIGVLYVKRGTPLKPILFGGDQEGGLRPGTENVALVEGIAEALNETQKIKSKEIVRLKKLQEYFLSLLQENSFFSGPRVAPRESRRGSTRPFKKENFFSPIINGDLKNRLPNNINITIPNIPSDLLVIELSARGVMASAKSACKSGDGKASHVISAINPTLKDTDGSLRFSLGRNTTKADIDDTLKALSDILKKLKKWYN